MANIQQEIWKPIQGYEGVYQISSLGRIKSLPRVDCRGWRRAGGILTENYDTDGYCIKILAKDRVNYTSKIHRLVAQAFIPNPNNFPQVNHIDGNKKNNSVENLEWVTNKQNIKHAVDLGLRSAKGQLNNFAILTNEQVLEIFHSDKKQVQLAKDYNISNVTIQRIKSGYQWSSVTGKIYNPKKRKCA